MIKVPSGPYSVASQDQARTWTKPEPIAGLGRSPGKDGMAIGVADVVPEYHAKTKTLLALGYIVSFVMNLV